MKANLSPTLNTRRAAFHALSIVLLAALALCATVQLVLAQGDTVTISATEFQRLAYSAHLHTKLALEPELEACLQVLLELHRRNPQGMWCP